MICFSSGKDIAKHDFTHPNLYSNRRDAYEQAANKSKKAKPLKLETMEDGDDADLAQALARARRAVQMQRAASVGDRATEVASEVAATKNHMQAHEEERKLEDDDLENAVGADGRRPDGSLVFTTTTEFTTRLQSRLHEKARSAAETAVKEEERYKVGVSMR